MKRTMTEIKTKTTKDFTPPSTSWGASSVCESDTTVYFYMC